MTTPSSQKAGERPIGFLLMDNARSGVIAEMSLIIRPEELTRDNPSRFNAQQTLGGAWVDDFGPGISTITLNGHTGWRGNASEDGAALFQRLYDTVFVQWHAKRRQAVLDGRDPNEVELIFADALDNFAVVVAPSGFQLKRHKSRPLLSLFNVNLSVMADVGNGETYFDLLDQITDAIQNPAGRYANARDSLGANRARQMDLARRVEGLLGRSMGQAARGFLEMSAGLLNKVQSVADDAAGAFDAVSAPLLYTATSVQQAGRNAFQMIAGPLGATEHVRLGIMEIASNFNDAYCKLRNGFNLLQRFPDFSDLFGASTCSSTGGGRPISPYADSNPFLAIYEAKTPPVTVTQSAQSAISMLHADPLSSTMSPREIKDRLADIKAGVAWA